MNHFPSTSWGKPLYDVSNDNYTFPIHQGRPQGYAAKDSFQDGVQRTQQPIVTGTSVLALKFKDGVMLAADNLASYGSLARFKDIRRLKQFGDRTIIGASGDMADFQEVERMLNNLITGEHIMQDGHSLAPSQIYAYLSNVLYAKRNKMDPYWNAFLVAGFEDDQPFLSYVDLLGVTYSSSTLATGFGNHLAQPLMRKAVESRGGDDGWKNIDEAQAREILENAMKVLFYRDARSMNKFQLAVVTKEGSKVFEPQAAPTEWNFAEKLRGYGNSDETI